MRINPDMLNRAIDPRQPKKLPGGNPFAPRRDAQTPAGVAQLAMDQSLDNVASWSYRSVQAQQSAFLEGQAFLGYPTLTLMAQRAEYATPLATITDDMTRKWIDLKAQAEDEGDDKQGKIDALNDKLEALDVRGAFKTAINASLEAGRGHIYLDTGDTLNRKELMSDLGYGARSATSAFKMGGK